MNRLPLRELYQSYIDAASSGDEETAALALDTVAERSTQAMCLVELSVASMSDRDLEEYIVRLSAGLEGGTSTDPASEAAEREVAGVQLEVAQNEMHRRTLFHEELSAGHLYAPSRTEIVGSLVNFSEMIREGVAGPEALASLAAIEDRIQQLMDAGIRGGELVGQLLIATDSLPDPASGEHPSIPWVKWAIVIELLANPRGFGDRAPHGIDPVTRAEAQRAKRIFLAYDRQDPKYEGDDWPLDLAGDSIGSLIEQSELARRYWHLRRMPESDLRLYLHPPSLEEPGRPEPHPQIVPEAIASRRAEQAGSFPLPMLYPLASHIRRRGAEHIWKEGIPPLPEGELGWSVYGVFGDIRLHGGAFPHPDGLLVSIHIPSERILRVGRTEAQRDASGRIRYDDKGAPLITSLDREQEELLERFEAEAERSSDGDEKSYRRRLRELLVRSGYLAIARYDYLYRETPTPQELILLDPSPRYISVIRESVPSFLSTERLGHRQRSQRTPL